MAEADIPAGQGNNLKGLDQKEPAKQGYGLQNVRNSGSSIWNMGSKLIRNGDILLPVGVMLILGMLLIPLPTWLLDILLAFSITIAVVVLMSVIFVNSPSELSSFPTILLLSALLRLGLNVASTRLILSEGHTGTDAAGDVIQAFGDFVAEGNYVIGLIVFAILVIINFVVITKGAGRIAEVAARFTLDAMPGKQMAIDADLSSGLINEQIARKRRADLQQESSFYGSMDGASKFVRGDAVAGLLITFINIVGGIIIGVVQRDMALSESAQNYTLLTIGDGLVSQIPALIISVAAGILVTKSGIDGQTEKALADQISSNPMALMIAATLLLALAVIPGMPSLPFLIMFAGAGGISLWLFISRNKTAVNKQESDRAMEVAEKKKETQLKGEDEPVSQSLQIDILRLELGYGLLPMVNSTEKGASLTDQIKALRRTLASRLGFVIPQVRVQDNLQLSASEYVIYIKEIKAGGGEIRPNMLLCINPDGAEGKFTIRGEKTIEPTFGLPALWINESQRDEAVFQGYTVIEPLSVITTHLSELTQQNMAEMLSYSSTQKLLDELQDVHKGLIKDLIPAHVSISSLQKVLQNLLRERVSIRDIALIIEAMGDAAMAKKNLVQATEHVRACLSRQICHELGDDRGIIRFLTLSPRWEQILFEALNPTADGDLQLNLEPRMAREFINKLDQAVKQRGQLGEVPSLLVSPILRPFIRSLTQRHMSQVPIISQNEVHPSAKYETVGDIEKAAA